MIQGEVVVRANYNPFISKGRRSLFLCSTTKCSLILILALITGSSALSMAQEVLDLSKYRISNEDTVGLRGKSGARHDCTTRLLTIIEILGSKNDYGKFNFRNDYWDIIRLENMTNTTLYDKGKPCQHPKAKDLCATINSAIKDGVKLADQRLQEYYGDKFESLKDSLTQSNEWGKADNGSKHKPHKSITGKADSKNTVEQHQQNSISGSGGGEASNVVEGEHSEQKDSASSKVVESKIKSVSSAQTNDTIELNVGEREWKAWRLGASPVGKDEEILKAAYGILRDTVSSVERKDSVFRFVFIPVLTQRLSNSNSKFKYPKTEATGYLKVEDTGQIAWVNPSSPNLVAADKKWMLVSLAFLVISVLLMVVLFFKEKKIREIDSQLANSLSEIGKLKETIDNPAQPIKELVDPPAIQAAPEVVPAPPVETTAQEIEVNEDRVPLASAAPSPLPLYAPYPAIADRLNAKEEKDSYDFFLLSVSGPNAVTGTVSIIKGLSGETIMAAMRNRYKYLEQVCEFTNEYEENVHRTIEVVSEGKVKKEGPYWIIDAGQKMKIHFNK